MSPRRAALLTYVLAGLIGLSSAARIAVADAVPWGTILVTTFASAIVTGPAVWLARDRLSAVPREHLRYVAFGVAMLCVPVVLGVSLEFEIPLVASFDGVIVGVVVGTLLVTVAERTVVPDRIAADGTT